MHQLATLSGEAGRYVHWGATTQDIMDTAVVLQVRDGARSDRRRPRRARGASSPPWRGRYRDTPMAGRTHLQQALPITFGYKAAIWLGCSTAIAQRLAQLRPRVLVGQFGGAAGTLASLGDEGIAVQGGAAAELGLAAPATTWHVARDGLAEAVSFLGLLGGSLGKIATDIMLMARPSSRRSSEPFVTGRGASSTMPQKRNPISSELILAAAKAVRQHAGLMLDAMVQDLERATGPWQAEWLALPESLRARPRALDQAQLHARGPDRRCRPHAAQPRHHRRPDRGRGGDDGAGAAHRPTAGA